ncbi:MAG: glycoside hydrolase family 1 protein [Myxococcales bacterium]|nr:glycoside hydrolase family 1 protein [Myxococcales bacterium]
MRHALSLLALPLFVAACSSDSPPATPADTGTDGAGDAAACGSGASVPKYVRGPAPEANFPKGFLFGAASAAMQIEKGLPNSDWYQWAKLPGKVINGDNPDDGPDALAHVDEDVKALVDAGANAYRFSIEWSRIYPTKADFDADKPDASALAKYHELLTKLRTAKIRPFVTLHHFSTPVWLSDVSKPKEPQAFERPEMTAAFGEFGKRMGKEFGAEVDDWVTINEPLILMLGAYVAAGHPPGAPLDLDRMVKVTRMLLEAHVAAYDGLHAGDTVDAGTGTKVQVSIAKHNRVFYPDDPCEEQDVAAAKNADYIWNEWIYDQLVNGDVDDDLDGKKEKTGDPKWKGKVDYIGVNYYGNTLVSARLKLKYLNGTPTYAGLATDLPKTDMDWDVFPHGFRPILKQLGKYKLPIYITENGIGDSQDLNKSRYLAEHLYEVGRAIEEDKLDIRGFFYWSLTDNFEWGSGFCPRFGLYRVDYTSPARPRTPTKAVATFKQIASGAKVTTALIDALPPYAAPKKCKSP